MADKLSRHYCVSIDENTAQMLEQLANIYQRKPAELLRLLVLRPLRDLWAEVQRNEHPENKEPIQKAIFRG